MRNTTMVIAALVAVLVHAPPARAWDGRCATLQEEDPTAGPVTTTTQPSGPVAQVLRFRDDNDPLDADPAGTGTLVTTRTSSTRRRVITVAHTLCG